MEDVVAPRKKPATPAVWEKWEKEDRMVMTKRLKNIYTTSKRYERLCNLWKNHVIRKKKKAERRAQRLAEKQPTPIGPTKLVVHTPMVREILVTDETKRDSFAVICLNGKQYKVVADDLLIVNQLKSLKAGDLVEADRVLLVGTKDYTLLGRPVVDGARVIMSVESQTKAKKIIVFKKKRRKGYRRSQGFRALQTFLRVHRVEFEVTPDLASRAVPLWTAPQIG